MSLLSDAMEKYVILNKSIALDGYGGSVTHWEDGGVIDCAAVLEASTESRTAEKPEVAARYTITTAREINLRHYDVLKRLRDGKIFRVLSDGDDNLTPAKASLNMRQVSAEEWILP